MKARERDSALRGIRGARLRDGRERPRRQPWRQGRALLGKLHEVDAADELALSQAPLVPSHELPDVLQGRLGQAPLHKIAEALPTLQRQA